MKEPRRWIYLACIALLSFSFLTDGLAQSRKKPAPATVKEAGPTAIRVDGAIIKSYIEYMAAPDKEGRKSLTPGYEKTAEWAAGKFKEWGLEPAGDDGTFLQKVPITGPRSAFAWTKGVPELMVEGRTFYVKDNDFVLDTISTPGSKAEGEILFAGYGISAPAKGLDEYAGMDVTGKIVLVFKGSPKDAPAVRSMMGEEKPEPKEEVEAWTDESKDRSKIMTAYEKGAAAILLFSPDKLELPNPFGPQAQTPAANARMGFPRREAIEGSPFQRPFLVANDLNERIVRQILWRDSQETARAFAARINRLRQDIRQKKACSTATGIKALVKGFDTTEFYGEKFKNNISHNVIGKVTGTDPTLKSQYILVGGHLDHMGIVSNIVYNGADDDASGAALTMEMARLFAANAATIKPKRTVLFALWCAEEMGLIGSNHFAKNPSDGVKIENIAVNFNADMVGLGNRLEAPGGLNFPKLFAVVMKNQAPEIASIVDPSTAGPGGSDYAAFIEQGVEALALMTTGGVGHPDYHDAGDKSDKIDPEILRKTGQFVLQGIINTSLETSVDMIVPNRLHLYHGMRLTPYNLAEGAAGRGRRRMQGMAGGPTGPQLQFGMSDISAFEGNTALIDVAAKLFHIGRVNVTNRGDGQWFGPNGLTANGRTALKAFESNGILLTLTNPSKKLLEDMAEACKKPFLVIDSSILPDENLAKKMNEKNVLWGVAWDPNSPQAVAARLIELKRQLGDSDNLLLLTDESSSAPMMGEEAKTTEAEKAVQRKRDEAKQQMYLALVREGWTKDEIYAMVGVSPARREGDQMPPMGPARLGGNLSRLNPPMPD